MDDFKVEQSTIGQRDNAHDSNRHPADRMAELKAAIAKLEAEYAALRDLIVTGGATQVGTEWVAVITASSARHINVAAAERALPPEVFSSLVHTTHQVRLTLRSLRPPRPESCKAASAR
jgi:hypothetical protein